MSLPSLPSYLPKSLLFRVKSSPRNPERRILTDCSDRPLEDDSGQRTEEVVVFRRKPLQ